MSFSSYENNNFDKYIPYNTIYAVSYHIAGSEENQVNSAVQITNKELFQGDLPADYGVYSSSMGTTDKAWRCSCCGEKKGRCPGHFGSIELNYPVKQPMFRDYIVKILKVICFRCGRLIVTKDVKVPSRKRLMEYARIATYDKINKCPHLGCEQYHATVVHDKADPAVIYLESTGPDGIPIKMELYNHIIKGILNRITDETIEKIGWQKRSHPRNLILSTIPIIPNTARPHIKRQVGNRINSSDDITTITKTIVELNQKIPEVIPQISDINKPLRDLYATIDMNYYAMIKGSTGEIHMTGSSGKPPKSICQRANKKEGRVRRHLLGKRTRYMARAVLTCDPALEVDQIGIPLSIAKNMQIGVKVQPYNYEVCMALFRNKHKIHPGITHVWKHKRGERFLADKVDSIEFGDILMRDLDNDDIAAANRQPSLTLYSLIGMRIVILMTGDSFRINESACAPLNADFDGDQINVIVCQNVMAREELKSISSVSKIFISRQKHAPYFGCFQDSLIGTAILTKSHIRINKWHAMAMFSNILFKTVPDICFNKQLYIGREMIGRFLPKINYPKRSPKMYKESYAPYMNYDPKEIVVEINRGELVSGVLDKKSIGQTQPGTIFHIINNEYGSRAALDTLHNFHQIVRNFLLWNSATIGIKDVVLPEHACAIIREKTNLIMNDALELVEKAHRRELIVPIGTSPKVFFESEILTKLSLGDDFIEPIYNNIDTNDGLMQFVLTGSKGDEANARSIYASLGQVLIGSNRMTKNFGYGRTSPYFLRGDSHPRANGFIDNSYREGIKEDIFSFVAAEARFNEIMKALSTSIAGAQARICTRNTESIMVSNLYGSVKKDGIIQLLFGDTGIDPAKVETVKFLTLLISNKQLETDYKSNIKDFDKIYQNKEVDTVLQQEYDTIVDDRETFRKIAFSMQDGNIGKNCLVSNERMMPINPFRIIEDVLYTYKDELDKSSPAEKRFDPVKAYNDVKQLCKDIAYTYSNENCKNENEKIPDYIEHSLTLMRILIRTYLCTSNLRRKGVTNKLLKIVINTIKKTFKRSLIPPGLAVGVIAAQCLSEPMVQYMIDSKLRAGTGGGTKTGSIDRVKEVFGAKTTEDMKNTTMTIMLISPHNQNKARVQEVANNIEMMNFGRFVDAGQIFFEQYGSPIHPNYIDEAKMIKEFERYYTESPPNNLSRWCIRFELNKEELFTTGMSLSTIIYNLQLNFPNVHFVHSSENAEKIIIRSYLQNGAYKVSSKQSEEQVIIDYMNDLLDTTLRGIRGIVYTEVLEVMVSKKMEDGSIQNVNEWYIQTNGTNLEDVLEHPLVDKYRTHTDSIDEMRDMFGIECARIRIVNELQKTMSVNDASTEHALLMADEMCNNGNFTSIQRTGLHSRDAGNVGLQIAFQAPIQVIEKAAVNGVVDIVEGVSSNFIYGQTPSVGTTYNEIIVNEPFVEKWFRDHNKQVEMAV
jgi:DNA-directed RNA polymerase II subunit RPB1